MENERQSRPAQSEAGQAIIEFALTITLTLMLIFGLIEFSRAIYTASVIQWAAQKGARAGIVESSEADIVVAVHGRMAGLDTSLALIKVSHPSADMVKVDVAYRYDLIVPIIERVTGESIQMRASATMVKY